MTRLFILYSIFKRKKSRVFLYFARLNFRYTHCRSLTKTRKPAIANGSCVRWYTTSYVALNDLKYLECNNTARDKIIKPTPRLIVLK